MMGWVKEKRAFESVTGPLWKHCPGEDVNILTWRNYYRIPTGSLDELSDAGWDGSAAGEPAMDSVVR